MADMNLYTNYLKEREGLDVIESEYGFATYKNRGPDFYIQDIYVVPEKRQSGEASRLADLIATEAKEKGVRMLTGSIDVRVTGAKTSDAVLRAYGMKPYSYEGYIVYYCKEIN